MTETQKTNKTPFYEVTPVTEPLDLSEGPHWDSEAGALYFVNLYLGEIHRYVPESNLHTSAVVGPKNDNKPVTFVVPLENQIDTFLIGYGGGLATVEWDGVSSTTKNLKPLLELEENFPALRLNDGKVSPSGVVFVGSMAERVNGSFPTNLGHLFAYDPVKKVSKVVLDGIGISNGLAWNADETVFYYIDSLSGQVKAYDYNAEDISLSNESTVFDFSDIGVNPPELLPDGMTIDVSGNLWVALNNHGKIYHINPETKTILDEIDFPFCMPVSSAAFGGPTLEDLYVTSIRRDLSPEERKKQPNAGGLFKVTGLGTKGVEGKKVNIF